MNAVVGPVAYVVLGAVVGWLIARRRGRPAPPPTAIAPAAAPPQRSVTRVDAHLASEPPTSVESATTKALRRDVQEEFEQTEAVQDLEFLDRLLVDIRDLSGGDEAIFWRWVETRQTLVPNAWSTVGAPRPAHFDVRTWGAHLRSAAEQRVLQVGPQGARSLHLVAAPVEHGKEIYGVLSITSSTGLSLDQAALQLWMPRFAAEVQSLLMLFDLRRNYARQMRHSEALLDAVQRLQGHRTVESLAEALSATACDVTSAAVAGLVRWNAAERHGVVQAISSSVDIEPGFHVTAETLVGKACIEQATVVLEDAQGATAEACPYGGLPRHVGSLVIVPIVFNGHVIGAVVVEGKDAGDLGEYEARNVELLAAVARGPLEIVWEIEEVTRRARTDPLTGLGNRRHFDEQLERVVAETDRFGGTCSLILADLDHFKDVNDQHGHDAGDAVLQHVAQVLRDAVRTVDVCARYGGEEIAVLLPQTSQQGAVELAERLRSTLEARPAVNNGVELPITASFGVATYPTPVPYGDWLLLAADKALYEAKAAGRNCVKVIQPSHVTPALYKSRR